jgi:hypothetical protein
MEWIVLKLLASPLATAALPAIGVYDCCAFGKDVGLSAAHIHCCEH